jgi:hypothetical protein
MKQWRLGKERLSVKKKVLQGMLRTFSVSIITYFVYLFVACQEQTQNKTEQNCGAVDRSHARKNTKF